MLVMVSTTVVVGGCRSGGCSRVAYHSSAPSHVTTPCVPACPPMLHNKGRSSKAAAENAATDDEETDIEACTGTEAGMETAMVIMGVVNVVANMVLGKAAREPTKYLILATQPARGIPPLSLTHSMF